VARNGRARGEAYAKCSIVGQQEFLICYTGKTCESWDIVFWRKRLSSPGFQNSVQEDWVAWLPENKHRVYEGVVREWEHAYAMLSVALNEALSHRAEGELTRARASIDIAGAMVNRLADPLLAAYQTLESRGRQLTITPPVNPLSPENFRGATAQENAAWNQLLHRILFGSRSRYLHKLRVLDMTVSAAADDFQEIAGELVAGVQIHPQESWSDLITLHYDLNTCFRETVIILKSFLRALPDSSLEAFRAELHDSASVTRERVRPKFSRVST